MSLFTQTIEVTQYTRTLSNGRFTNTPITPLIPIQCSIQPVSNGDRVILQGMGKNIVKAKLMYTTTELNTSDQYTDTPADTVEIKGRVYEVLGVDEWDIPSDLSYYSYYLVMKDQGDD